MEKITVNWNVSISYGSETLTLNCVNCKTMEEWESLDKSEQKDRLQNALDELPERVCIIVDDWD